MRLGFKKSGYLITIVIVVIMTLGICLGNYLGYVRGYHEGQKITNAWWIDKQSQYYDSNEVEKTRRARRYNWY